MTQFSCVVNVISAIGVVRRSNKETNPYVFLPLYPVSENKKSPTKFNLLRQVKASWLLNWLLSHVHCYQSLNAFSLFLKKNPLFIGLSDSQIKWAESTSKRNLLYYNISNLFSIKVHSAPPRRRRRRRRSWESQQWMGGCYCFLPTTYYLFRARASEWCRVSAVRSVRKYVHVLTARRRRANWRISRLRVSAYLLKKYLSFTRSCVAALTFIRPAWTVSSSSKFACLVFSSALCRDGTIKTRPDFPRNLPPLHTTCCFGICDWRNEIFFAPLHTRYF